MDERMEIQLVDGYPIPKEPLTFFQFNQDSRYLVSIADKPSTWQKDLILGERFFSEMIVCPFTESMDTHIKVYEQTKDILKERMKYPGANEDPSITKIAKTWILPTKVHIGPEASTFLNHSESSVKTAFQPIFETLKNTDSKIHILKIEVSEGKERQLLFKFLDNGFRPSLILVKWSYDLDDHMSTAHSSGHLLNSGYSLVHLEGDYALYMFSEQVLYDTASMKTTGLKNPMIENLLQSVSEHMKVTKESNPEENNSTIISSDSYVI
jgi:hypothetical protein